MKKAIFQKLFSVLVYKKKMGAVSFSIHILNAIKAEMIIIEMEYMILSDPEFKSVSPHKGGQMGMELLYSSML